MKHRTTFLLSCVFLLSACSDFLKREIDIDTADSAPKVTVTSALEDQLFYIYVGLSSPLSKSAPEPKPVEKAHICLFEEGISDPICEITRKDASNTGGMYNSYGEPPYALRTNIRVKPGKSYTLTVEVEGYPPVSSTVTAPSAVEVSDARILNYNTIEVDYNKIANVNKYMSGGCSTFYPLGFTIKDNPATKDYYMFEVYEIKDGIPATEQDVYSYFQKFQLATSERVLIQDNPDIVANQWLSETEKNTFSFEQMIVSDLSFSGQQKDLYLMLSSCQMQTKDDNCEFLHAHYQPDRIKKENYTVYLSVRHLDEGSYHYYRTFALQEIGLDFFSEPVSLLSNIEGGYGCFAVCTSTKVILEKHTICSLTW